MSTIERHGNKHAALTEFRRARNEQLLVTQELSYHYIVIAIIVRARLTIRCGPRCTVGRRQYVESPLPVLDIFEEPCFSTY